MVHKKRGPVPQPDFVKDAYYNMMDFVYHAIPDIEQNKPVRDLLSKTLGYDKEEHKNKIGFETDCIGTENEVTEENNVEEKGAIQAKS